MNLLVSAFSRIIAFRLADLTVPRREEGQTLVEYALILSLIAVVVVVVLITLGGKISSLFNGVSSQL